MAASVFNPELTDNIDWDEDLQRILGLDTMQHRLMYPTLTLRDRIEIVVDYYVRNHLNPR